MRLSTATYHIYDPDKTPAEDRHALVAKLGNDYSAARSRSASNATAWPPKLL